MASSSLAETVAAAADTSVSNDVDVGVDPKSPSNATNTDDNASASIDPESSLTLRALVSTKEAGVIIGKGGANVADLREKTDVKAGVSKVVQGVHDRVLSVTGNLEGISKAYALIGQTILENPVTASSSSPDAPAASPVSPPAHAITSVRLLISHNLMGSIIGRQGLKIKHIQDVSGARMVASKDMLPQSTERVVEIQGTTEALRIAIYEIAKCLKEDWERGQGTVFYQPGQVEGAGVLAAGGVGGMHPQSGRRQSTAGGTAYLPGAMSGLSFSAASRRSSVAAPTSGGGPRRFSTSQNPEAAAGAVVTPGGGLNVPSTTPTSSVATALPAVIDSENIRTQNISIPADMVGCIIGKGGSKITEIRRLSGSRIR